MLMEIKWPVVIEQLSEEKPVVYVFWCNDGNFEWRCDLDSLDKLPFDVLT